MKIAGIEWILLIKLKILVLRVGFRLVICMGLSIIQIFISEKAVNSQQIYNAVLVCALQSKFI